MKKILYFLLLTLLLFIPIIYWLCVLWKMQFFEIFSWPRIYYVYSIDSTFKYILIINSILYLLGIIGILQLKHSKTNESEIKKKTSDVDSPSFIIQNPNTASWNALYDTKVKQNVVIPNIEKMESEQTPIDTQNNLEKKQDEIVSSAKADDNVVELTPVSPLEIYKQQIADMLTDYGYKTLGDCEINNVDVDFISIAESDTLIIGKINPEYGSIIANETEINSGDIPTWFTLDQKYNSPVWEVKKAYNAVVKMVNEVLPEDNGIMIKPIVVIPNASVSNQTDIEAKWKEMGVDVVRFLNHSELPRLTDVIPDKKDTEVLESYENFVNTLIKYFNQHSTKKTLKKKVG